MSDSLVDDDQPGTPMTTARTDGSGAQTHGDADILVPPPAPASSSSSSSSSVPAVLDDDQDLAASLQHTATRLRASQVGPTYAPPPPPGGAAIQNDSLSAPNTARGDTPITKHNSIDLTPAFDPSHTVRSRTQDPSHPSSHLSASGPLLASCSSASSLIGVFELLIHFEVFKNVDLFRQGLYFLKTSFFTIRGDRKDRSGGAAAGSGARVAVGRGAADSSSTSGGHESDFSHSHDTQESALSSRTPIPAAALQAAIAQWESAVHDLNAPPPPAKKDDKSNSSDSPAPTPTTESVMNLPDGDIILRKAKVALPYYILPTAAPDDGDLFSFADKPVYPSSIHDGTNHFYSRTFRVQYCEQEFLMNDACLFRLELNLRHKTPVYMEVELMFAEFTIADAARGRPMPKIDEFQTVSRHLNCMQDIYEKGVHEFIPITFDDYHFASVKAVLHSQLIDFKFRPPPNQAHTTQTHTHTDSKDDSKQSHASYASASLSNSRVSIPVAEPVSPSSGSSSSSSSSSSRSVGVGSGSARPGVPTHTVGQILFPRMVNPDTHAHNRIHTTPVTIMQLANDYHQLFLQTLILAYNQLASVYFRYRRHCVSGLQRVNLKELMSIPPLELPAEVAPVEQTTTPGRTSRTIAATTTTTTHASSHTHAHSKAKKLKKSHRSRSRSRSRPRSQTARGAASASAAASSSSLSSELGAPDGLSPRSRSRRSSLDAAAIANDSHLNAAADEVDIDAAYFLPQLYTLAYRIRAAGACCAWEQPDTAASLLLADLQLVSQQVFTLWNAFQHLLPHIITQVVEYEKPSEQVLLFEDMYHEQRTEEDAKVTHTKFEIIDSHFEGRRQTKEKEKERPEGTTQTDRRSPSTSVGTSPSASSSSSSVVVPPSPRSVTRLHEPSVSLAAEESMSHIGPMSDSIGARVLESVPRENMESQVGPEEARHAVAPLSVEDIHPSIPPHDTTPRTETQHVHVDFDAVSRRISEATLARRASQIASGKIYDGKHLVVLCHGYQGSSWDMRLFKNHISLLHPHVQVYASTSNEGQTEGDILAMGRRLAEELDTYLSESCTELGRLSFVCHSLGGIIVRSALSEPPMIPYLSKLYSYMSLATPHCGYLFSENSMLNTGIWFLQRWNKSACLSQLSLSDAEDPQACFLYQLAKKPSLQHFKHVFLLASQQDKYAPFHSARIEIHPQSLTDRKKGTIYNNLVSSLLGSMTRPDVTLRRFDMCYKPAKRTIDSFIGRTAHINFLTHTNYVRHNTQRSDATSGTRRDEHTQRNA